MDINGPTQQNQDYSLTHFDVTQQAFDSIFMQDNSSDNYVEQKHEAVNHPNHYLGERKFEPIDVINDWDLNFQTGNAVKYISRAGRKDVDKTIQDLEKAIWYLQWEVKRLKNYE